jgi:hypothetical protein
LNRIVGIVPVKAEDPIEAWAIEIAPEFCEQLIVPDNHPSGGMPEQLDREISSFGRLAPGGLGGEAVARVEQALAHPAAIDG